MSSNVRPPPVGSALPENPMEGFDEIHPRLRRIIHTCPYALRNVEILTHQRVYGVMETERLLLVWIRKHIPDFDPDAKPRPPMGRALREKRMMARRLRQERFE